MTMSEFSEELGVPKTTLQSVMKYGNTTVDTLVRISNASGKSLDNLVFGGETMDGTGGESSVLRHFLWFCQLPSNVQQQLCFYLDCITKLLEDNNEQRNT